MIKVVVLGRRKEGISHEECIKYWTTKHADLVKALAPPTLKKYVVSSAVGALEGEPSFDGMAEVWFDNREAAKDFVADNRLSGDAANFLDGNEKYNFMFMEENIILE